MVGIPSPEQSAMFNINRGKKGGDGVRKSIQKLLDPKRDADKRLGNLRHIIENATEVRAYFFVLE